MKEYWSTMPWHLKNKITWSRNHVDLDAIVEGKLDITVPKDASVAEAAKFKKEALLDAIKTLAGRHLPTFSGAEWDGGEPDFSDVLNEVFGHLEHAVLQVAAGGQTEEEEGKATKLMNDAAAACQQVLEE